MVIHSENPHNFGISNYILFLGDSHYGWPCVEKCFAWPWHKKVRVIDYRQILRFVQFSEYFEGQVKASSGAVWEIKLEISAHDMFFPSELLDAAMA